jgi:transposase
MLQYAVPPGYQRQQPIKRPKLGPWLGVIDAILNDDKQRPLKQRHTSKRIFERLKEEHGFTGGYTIVKDYVRGEQLRSREMFVPLTHAPGEAQVDFGEALVVIAGVEQKAHYLAMDLPHSDDCFVAAFPAETTEAFFEGHVLAFAYFGSNAAIFRRSLFICDIFTRTRASAHILDITNVNAIPGVVRGVEETVGSIDDLVIFGSTGYPEALP